MFDIVGRRFWFFIISGALILIGIISLLTFGLKSGIEFSSGSMLTVKFEQEVEQVQLEQALVDLGYSNVIVQQTQPTGNFLIRTYELSGEEKTSLENGLKASLGDFAWEPSFKEVTPMIAKETSLAAFIAIIVAAVGILAYITWAFRRMPKPLRYGACGIIALAHDAVVALGIFSILGAILDWEINLMFITGILAVIGYSINNTVVVFDRIRENLSRGVSADFEVVVNSSLVESLGRSLNTSLTTLFVVVALLLFVGATIQNFAVVLLIGVVAGTFSSLCIAPTLLVVWEKGEWGRFINWFPLRALRARD